MDNCPFLGAFSAPSKRNRANLFVYVAVCCSCLLFVVGAVVDVVVVVVVVVVGIRCIAKHALAFRKERIMLQDLDFGYLDNQYREKSRYYHPLPSA